jgi:hypothetical protein
MGKSKDEKTIEAVTNEILQNNNTAMAMLLIALATPEAFKDEFEWSYSLGKLFSVAMEVGFHKKNEELLYNEAGEAIVDDQINQMLGKFNVIEKTNIAAFLLAASKPTTQAEIDSLAEQICKKQIEIH